jgi:hypothetical protein
MSVAAYQIEHGEKLPYDSETFTGDYALPSARGTFERLKAENKSARLTRGSIDDITQEYTASHLLEECFKKPYACSDPACGKLLSFPEAFFFLDKTYCSKHLPEYSRESEGW